MTHVAAPTPTQIAFPWKATIRTIIQGFFGFAAAVTALLLFPDVRQFLEQYLPPQFVGYVYGFGVFVAALAGVIARVMALPQVQPFLTAIGLGPVPKSLSK